MIVRQAKLEDLPTLAILFDQYRQFYKCDSNIKLASEFLHSRMEKEESIIFICLLDNIAVGFTQLYPTFCSVDACRIFVLYDLYVISSHRRAGIGSALMSAAKTYANTNGASRLDLETEITNDLAQALYSKLGYQRDTDFYKYSLEL